MKKYLLLATVAGCLLSANAMAGGSIATNKQSAIINVKANVQIATELQDLQDMDFGTLYVLSGTSGDLVSMSTAGEVSIISAGVVAKKGNAQPGSINTNAAYAAFTITCADGTGAPLEGGTCSLGNGLVLKNVVSDGDGFYGDALRFGGTLSATAAVTAAKNIDAPGIKVEIQY